MGLQKDAMKKLILQLAHNAGITGFKRMDAFDTLKHLLPVSESREAQLRFVGNLLVLMYNDGYLKGDDKGKTWFYSELGENSSRIQ